MMASPSRKFLLLIALGLSGLVCFGSARAVEAKAPAEFPKSPQASPSPAPVSGSAPAAAPELTPVTRVVGEVSDHFVTSREARMNRALEPIIQSIGSGAGEEPTPLPPPAKGAAAALLAGTESNFPAEVSRVLDEWAIYLEAKSLSSPEASKAEIARIIKAATDLYGSKDSWRTMEPSQDELRAIAERKLIARDFQKLKGSSSLAPITESDALQYFRRNRLRFGTVPFAAVRENIKAFLTKQQTEKRLEEWKEVLRRKYKVRNFIAG